MSPGVALDCRSCEYFNARAEDLEAAFPGLASLSSAFASVRAHDGLCAQHERYVSASSVCDRHSLVARRLRTFAGHECPAAFTGSDRQTRANNSGTDLHDLKAHAG